MPSAIFKYKRKQINSSLLYGILVHTLGFSYGPAGWKIPHNSKEAAAWKYYQLYPISKVWS